MRALSLSIVFTSACSMGPGEALRDYTTAPELSYLSKKDDVRPVMKRFATAIVNLNQTLVEPNPGEAERARIFAWLNEIESAAKELSKPGVTYHPKIDAHLDRFIRDIEAAKRAAHADPPNYYLIGSLNGSCMYCHRRDAPADFKTSSL